MKTLAALLVVPALILPLQAGHRRGGPVSTAREAKAIAEQETKGQAVSAQRIHLNGASGGWEVDVHMPQEDRGWRCIVDCDTHRVRTRDRIPNPAGKKKPH
ncbi:PepSY domain-containing protein [Holophaga foetida]|uniref:PepSY domain-containing protein n=1 Tax=Holophaga foetida TaxID=35839 RepID=UPI000247183F|nr:PepSY domain-containing protein [Holophaga foetida]